MIYTIVYTTYTSYILKLKRIVIIWLFILQYIRRTKNLAVYILRILLTTLFSYDNCANAEYALGLFTDERKLLQLLARIFLHTMSCGLKSREKLQISCTYARSTKGYLRYSTTVSAVSSASILVVCSCLFRASSLLRINQKEKMLRFILVCVVDLVSQALLCNRVKLAKAHIPFQLVFGDPLLNLYSHLISVCNFLKRHVRLVTSQFGTKSDSITSLGTSFGATGLS